MNFRIADTFTDSLAKLTGEEQKAVKTTAFDLQLNPVNPGMSFHKLDKVKDKNFWSVRVNRDIRLIVHKTDASLLLCYVDHHDNAYQWAERRKLETHPATGAAQLVEIRERIEEIIVKKYTEIVQPKAAKPLLFGHLSDDDLLGYGVPPEWLADVRLANEDSLLVVADHLPAEAAEALLELATGGKPEVVRYGVPDADPFAHPDALRRFRVMNDVEELERALAYPWDKWTVFLHPAQRQWVERDYSGPARVSGSAGTGKTVVALHRAVFLARSEPDSRVLLATFSEPLANALHNKLRRLIGNTPRLAERLEVHAMDAIGERLYQLHFEPPRIAARDVVRQHIADALVSEGNAKFSLSFLLNEWEEVVDARQLDSWESFRGVSRLGRKTRLTEPQRASIWTIFETVRERLRSEGLITRAEMFTQLAEVLRGRTNLPFDFVVVDEAQDMSIAQLRFLSVMGGGRPNSLFFAGDLGQRIFQQPFSWKSLGVDIRGRARTLHINYRTSHQIRTQADRLLGPEVSDVDGNAEDRRGTVSVFNGPAPVIRTFDSEAEETDAVVAWLKDRSNDGFSLDEIAIFVRSEAELSRARACVSKANLPFREVESWDEPPGGQVFIGTMHLAKGLEFRVVAVIACDDEVLPLQSRIQAIGDGADLDDVYETERQLLYVACTRARDQLLVTGVEPASEYLDDLRG
jgi:mRNA-degrading endonuclease RelE of RelBE toxin-antitoxin system